MQNELKLVYGTGNRCLMETKGMDRQIRSIKLELSENSGSKFRTDGNKPIEECLWFALKK